MKDQLVPLASSLPPGIWPYWASNLVAGTPPAGDPWPQNPPMAADSGGGVLGSFARPAGGVLGNLVTPAAETANAPHPAIHGPVAWTATGLPPGFLPAWLSQHSVQDRPVSEAAHADTRYTSVPAGASDQFNPSNNNGGVAAANASKQQPTEARVPLYGPGDVLLPPPEPAPAPPPTDFRTWLRDALSDENTRYYLGPHFFEALRKLHALTQLLPGSGTVQSAQDASRASEQAQAGNYGRAAAHLGMGTVNAALDWLPPAKLAIIGGTMAKTFPWDRLPTAMGMEAAGKSVDEIWRAAGLARAADDRWTFDISDKGYQVRPNAGEPTIWEGVTHAPL